MDCILSESSSKGTILRENYRKMTIIWSFSSNFFVKFHGLNKFGSLNVAMLHPDQCYNKVFYKGIALFYAKFQDLGYGSL